MAETWISARVPAETFSVSVFTVYRIARRRGVQEKKFARNCVRFHRAQLYEAIEEHIRERAERRG